ncbi:SDR family oxidoreductase [Polynucleobacter paneuropaeus]|nr:SDR family oxidoreductase [Polynucleobacter paneuropaeus]
MMKPVCWVLGGGLLGSSTKKALLDAQFTLYTPSFKFHWGDKVSLEKQMQLALKEFSSIVKSSKWRIFWTAGIGTMHSDGTYLSLETDTLKYFINLIKDACDIDPQRGNFIYASSAGAVYAGCLSSIINENTLPNPVNPYGQHKLMQESIVQELSVTGVVPYIFRISTLYGDAQSAVKRQGLLTEIARRVVRNDLIQIYVSLDTMRDYIFVDDAVKVILRHLEESSFSNIGLRIVASENPVTISRILKIFKLASKKIFP